MSKTYTGINIQYPISQSILDGSKTIETRTYPLPEKFLNKELAMVETPGKNSKFKARVVAIVKFTKVFKYLSASDFYEDINRHQVTKESPWAWQNEKPKWGWKIEIVRKLDTPTECIAKGIVYRMNVTI